MPYQEKQDQKQQRAADPRYLACVARPQEASIMPRIVLVPAFVLATASSACQSAAVDSNYMSRVEAWRAKHEADYAREFVPLAGLFFLERGANRVGSDPSSRVRLPDRAPASIGDIVYENGEVRFEPSPGAPVTSEGNPIASPIPLRPASSARPADEVVLDDMAFWVHLSGPRHAIRLRDPQGEQARMFLGFRWYPIDEQYRVVARFIRDAAPRQLQVASLTGDAQTFTTEGVVEFTLHGAALRLRPMTPRPGRLYFVFNDGTSGKETYAAARFLYSDLAPDGTTVLDFNEAYNPPCAFNPYTTCPLPLPENRLTIPIRAGELDYPHPPKLP
jgi:uncharacterized protein (DUF1684 family)